MKYLFYFFIFCIITISTLKAENNFKVAPVFFSKYKSNGGDWHFSKQSILINGFGLTSKYLNNDLEIISDYIQLFITGNIDNDKFLYFSPEQSFPYLRSSLDADGYWTENATMKISYNYAGFKLIIGKYNNNWGPGKRSIHISNKAPSYPKFGFRWEINKKITLDYFHGILHSGIIDSSKSKYYLHVWENSEYESKIGSRNITIDRYIAAHRIEWNVNKKLKLVANESVIYGMRGFDFHYLMALAPFLQIEDYLGDLDNIQMGSEISYSFNSNRHAYLCFYMDELTPERIFKKDNHNWFAWQTGIKFNNLIYIKDQFIIEYNWVDHRVYKHKFEMNNFYSHDQPLGFWAGPHSQEFFLEYQIDFRNNTNILFYFSNTKRGPVTEEIIFNKYNEIYENQRFDSGYEQKSIVSLNLNKGSNYKKLNFSSGIEIINWKNYMFDKKDPEQQTGTNVKKLSFNFSILYNIN